MEGNSALLVEPGAGVLVAVCGNKAVSVPSTAIELADGPREKLRMMRDSSRRSTRK